MSSFENKQWANKKSRLYKNMLRFFYPEVSPSNTRHEKLEQIQPFVVAPDFTSGCHPHDLSRPSGIPPSRTANIFF
jgi:hypothetical protein